MASGIYNIFKTGVMAGSYRPTTGGTYPMFLALLNNSYTFDADHKFVGQFIGTYQITGTAYVAGGHALSTPVVSQVDASDYGKLDFDDWVLGVATVTARFAVIYSSYGGGFGSDPLVCCMDFATDKSASGGSFTIQFAGGGVVNIT